MAILSLKTTLLSATLLLSASQPVLAQDTFSFIPSAASSTFPACGLSCQDLQEAQAACAPPQAAVSNSQTYISCFCQSAFISSLSYSAALCPTCTSASDQQLLIHWFNGYCAGGYTSTMTASTATATTSTASSTTSGTTAASATSTVSASGKESSSSSDDTSSSSGSKSWFSTHWRWVVMLIILIIGFSALAAAAIWLKKRLDAKQPGLYHGDDRKDGGSGSGQGPAAAFFAGSLRNLSRSNVPSARDSMSTTNNNVGIASKVPKIQQQPNMSTTSVSNRRSSTLTNSVISNHNNNMNSGNHEMWGPNQARNFENVAPVEEPVFRNSMASAAAAAAFGGGAAGTTAAGPEAIGIASTTDNNSRTDLSSVGTGGGRGTPRNFNRLNMQSASASNLHQQLHQQETPYLREAQSHADFQRPHTARP